MKADDGNLQLARLDSYTTATLPSGLVALHLGLAGTKGTRHIGMSDFAQCSMTRDEARQIGAALLRLADAPHIAPAQGSA